MYLLVLAMFALTNGKPQYHIGDFNPDKWDTFSVRSTNVFLVVMYANGVLGFIPAGIWIIILATDMLLLKQRRMLQMT